MSFLLSTILKSSPRSLSQARFPARRFPQHGTVRTYAGAVGCGASNLVSIVPYFKVPDENMVAFKKNVTDGFYPLMVNESKCVFYNFTFSEDNVAHCREVYEGAEGVLEHLANVDAPLQQALSLAEMTTLQVHGPAEELEKLKEPLKDLPVKYFTQM